MKIVSLLPSATEIVFALGLDGALEAVTFECDHPVAARRLPQVVGSNLVPTGGSTPGAIDAAVSAAVAAGGSIYALDEEAIRRIQPDVILTQDLCRVCAVPAATVEDALEAIGCGSTVVSLDPHRLEEVIACIGQVGEATGVGDRAEALMADLHERLDRVSEAVAGRPRPRVLVLEWADPPYDAGHWFPDMVHAAGGRAVLAEPGARSQRLSWERIGAEPVDVLLFAPCGFGLDAAVAQAEPLLDRPELASIPRVVAFDGNGYGSRPGPRLVDGVEVLADLFHGTACSSLTPEVGRRLR